jgi:hypothetical protein
MKFLCLAYEDETIFHNMPHDEWLKLRDETLNYVESLRHNGKLIMTEPLQSARKANTVQIRNGMSSITDGPFAETKEQLGGFFLIDVKDQDEAVQIALKWPSARLGKIEVRPIEPGLNTDARYD